THARPPRHFPVKSAPLRVRRELAMGNRSDHENGGGGREARFSRYSIWCAGLPGGRHVLPTESVVTILGSPSSLGHASISFAYEESSDGVNWAAVSHGEFQSR